MHPTETRAQARARRATPRPNRDALPARPAPTASFRYVTEFFAVRDEWSAFTSIEETRSYIVLIDRFGNAAAMIPRTALAEHAPAFLDLAREQTSKAPPRA